MLKFHCTCGKKIAAPDEYEGRRVKCPKCGVAVVARREAEPNDAAAVALSMIEPESVEVARAAPPAQMPATATAQTLSPQGPAQVYVQHPPATYSATVVNIPQQKGASGFGIAALVIGIVAVMLCWIPLLGMISIPLGLIALLLGVIGFIVSLTGGKSGVGLPVAGGFLGAMAIAVPLLWVGAVATAVGSAAANANRTNQTIVGATTAAAGESAPQWAPADQPVSQDGVQLKVTHVRLGKVKVRGSFGRGESFTDDALLAVVIEVTNTSATKKVDFLTWSGRRYSFGVDGPTLRDNFDNSYDLKSFDSLEGPVEQVVTGSIYPSKSVTDVVVFEPPVDGVSHVDLVLPAVNAGGEGKFRIRIPASIIEKT